jgi:hypothetical protein
MPQAATAATAANAAACANGVRAGEGGFNNGAGVLIWVSL